MKPTSLLLLASLSANVALIALVAIRPAAPTAAPQSAPTAAGQPRAKPAAGEDALRAALASGSRQELEAAGLSPELARELSLGRTFSRAVARLQAEKSAASDERWWRMDTKGPQFREAQLVRQRELNDVLAAVFGPDAGLFVALGSTDKNAFLPPAKREALRRIMQDYDEMMAKFSAGGVQLASDQEKLKLLRAERDRDIAALLTPEERLAFEMRTSSSAAVVRARYGDGIQNEEDYRKIYALQKAFDEKFPMETLKSRTNPEGMKAFTEAQRQLQEDIRSALGDTAYANLRRATDGDLRTVDALAARLNLPAGTGDRIATARENFAAESQRINADNSVPFPQRRAQIQEVAARARAEVQQVLGTEAAEAYLQRSPWMSMLQGGIAFSTTPQANSPSAGLASGQSVFPVLPTPAPGASPTKVQMVIADTAAAAGGVGPGHGDMFISGPPSGVRENVQVMTFSTTTSESGKPPADGAAGTQTRTVIVAPPPAAPPPK